MTGFNFTRRVGRARNLTAAEVDANFQAASDALEAAVIGGGGGGGVSNFTALTDAATADLPGINTRLATALNARVPQTRTVNGSPLSADITLTKASVGLSSVDNTADTAKPISTAQQSALDLKAAGGLLVAYSGTALTLTSAHNGNIIRTSNSSAVAVTVPSGLPAGFSCVVIQGAAGLVTAVQGSGVTLTASPALVTRGAESDLTIAPSGTNAYTVYSPATGSLSGMSDIATYDIASNNTSVAAIVSGLAENAVDAVAGALAAGTHTNLTVTYNDGANSISLASVGGAANVASVSGSTSVGSVLTCTPTTGWAGTFQWTRDGSNISSATSGTYTTVSGDGGHTVTCKFTPGTYSPTGIAVVSGSAGLSETHNTGTAENITTVGYTDYIVQGGSGNYTHVRKVVSGSTLVNILTGPTFFGGINYDTGTNGDGVNISWTDGYNDGPFGTIAASSSTGYITDNRAPLKVDTSGVTFPCGFTYTAPADTSTKHVKLIVGVHNNSVASGTNDVLIKASVSGGGVTALSLTPPGMGLDSVTTWTEYDFAYAAASGGQTLTITVQAGQDGGTWTNTRQVFCEAVLYQA